MDKRFYRAISLLILVVFITFALITLRFYQKSASVSPEKPEKNVETSVSEQFREFAARKQQNLADETTASFAAVGDISFSRGVERVVKFQKNVNFPFINVREILSDADIAYANLETPITQGTEIPDGSMTFRSNPGTEEALKWAGIDVVSLANNHTYNFDVKGLTDTFSYLDKAGIQYVGAGHNNAQATTPVFIEKNNIKFALLAYEEIDIVPAGAEATEVKPGIAFMRTQQMQTEVSKAKQRADVVVVAMHAGEEYVPLGNDLQTNFAHAAIDAGAELVIGDHPHVVQNAEIYKDKVIFYSLGNFVMDQMWSDDTRRALIIKGIFSKNGLEKFYATPVQIEHYAQPNPVYTTLGDTIIKRLQIPMANSWTVEFDSTNNTYKLNSVPTFITKVGSAKQGSLPRSKVVTADLDADNMDEMVKMHNGSISIKSNNKDIWQSPNNWWVDDFVIAASLNDGRLLLNVSVWKEGNYGESMPFWEEKNDNSIKNHLFVFGVENGKFKHIWQSSNLPAPNCAIQIKDVDNDGQNELIAYEGNYSASPDCDPEYASVWRWREWGFYNLWRSQKILHQ